MLICGAGGHAKVIFDILNSQGVEVQAFVGKNESISEFMGIPVEANYDPAKYPESSLIIGTGDNQLRKKIALEVTHEISTVIEESASVSKHAHIGSGTVIFHQSVVQAGTRLGNHVIINSSASVDHDCVLEDFVHVSPNATLCGGVTVGEGTLVGAGAVIIPNTKIGKWSVIGAGAVVVEDIPDHCVVMGNPAKVVKNTGPDE